MRYAKCGYSLHGPAEHRCPECGRPFDPDDATTFKTKARCGRRHLVLSLCGVGLIAVPLVLSWWNDLREAGGLGPVPGGVVALLFVPWMPAGFVLEYEVLASTSRALSGNPDAVERRGRASRPWSSAPPWSSGV